MKPETKPQAFSQRRSTTKTAVAERWAEADSGTSEGSEVTNASIDAMAPHDPELRVVLQRLWPKLEAGMRYLKDR